MKVKDYYTYIFIVAVAGLLLKGLQLLQPPPVPPVAVLSCTTSGLPDLAVVCYVGPSQSTIVATTINFGDGRSVPLRRQVYDDQEDQGAQRHQSVTSVYQKYREPGLYRINLVVTDDDGIMAEDHQDVRVSYSDELEREIRLIDLEVTAYGDDERSVPLNVPVNARLGIHNLIFYEQRRYTVPFAPSPGWVIRDCDKDLQVTDKYFFLGGNLEYTETEGTYIFSLQSSPFFSGSEDGYLYANISCREYPEEVVKSATIKAEQSIRRYGIIEVALGNSNPMVGTSHEADDMTSDEQLGDWKVKFSGDKAPITAKWSEPIKYRGFRLTLVDLSPVPAHVRRNRAYVRIEPDD